MYISKFGVRKRSTRKILYLEGSSKISKKSHTFLGKKSVWLEPSRLRFEERKPVSVQEHEGEGPS